MEKCLIKRPLIFKQSKVGCLFSRVHVTQNYTEFDFETVYTFYRQCIIFIEHLNKIELLTYTNHEK